MSPRGCLPTCPGDGVVTGPELRQFLPVAVSPGGNSGSQGGEVGRHLGRSRLGELRDMLELARREEGGCLYSLLYSLEEVQGGVAHPGKA